MSEKQGSGNKDLLEDVFAEGLFCEISDDLCIQDILANPGITLPDYMEGNEVLLLLGYLPEERWPELSGYIELLGNSVSDKPADYEGWLRVFRDKTRDPSDRTIALVMMVTLATDLFSHWLAILRMIEKEHIALKRVAARHLLWLAKSNSEISVAKRIEKEVGLS
jgi:hypothetical protein